jgi:hypothetical protein
MLRLILNKQKESSNIFIVHYTEKVEVDLKVFDHFGEAMELQYLK